MRSILIGLLASFSLMAGCRAHNDSSDTLDVMPHLPSELRLEHRVTGVLDLRLDTRTKNQLLARGIDQVCAVSVTRQYGEYQNNIRIGGVRAFVLDEVIHLRGATSSISCMPDVNLLGIPKQSLENGVFVQIISGEIFLVTDQATGKAVQPDTYAAFATVGSESELPNPKETILKIGMIDNVLSPAKTAFICTENFAETCDWIAKPGSHPSALTIQPRAQ